MSARLRSHIRGNVVGYLALFVALSGTAYAVTAPKNSVTSKSIRNGQVKSVDLQDNGVQSVDIQDHGVEGIDLAPGAVGSSNLAPGAVQASNLAPGAAGESGFAHVNGTTSTGRGIASVEHTNASGIYCITPTFPAQRAVATPDAGPAVLNESVQVQIPGGPAGLGCAANQIGVITEAGITPTVQDLPFFIAFE